MHESNGNVSVSIMLIFMCAYTEEERDTGVGGCLVICSLKMTIDHLKIHKT